MKENDISPLCNVYDLCKSELIAGCVQASEKDVQEWWKSCQQVLHPEKSDFGTKEKVVLMITKLLSEKSELLEKTEKLETEVAELRARLEKAVELPYERKRLLWGDKDKETLLCPDCLTDIMGGIGDETFVVQCPNCGCFVNSTIEPIEFTSVTEARIKELQEVDEVEE